MGIFNINGLTYLDGGTGTNLEAAGLPNGVCVEKWIADNPAPMEMLQKRYIEAGSQIIYAPTFGLNYGIFSK